MRNLGRTLLSTAGLAVALISPGRLLALDPTQDKILYVVADAHLDTEWNWTIQDTINTYIPATLHTNFNFFAKYPHYTFSFEGSFRYRLAKEYYPADYVTLSNYIAQGRWRVSGSAVDAADVNVPSPESLMRQTLYANSFWRKEFGKTSADIFLPDCFGFGWALPSVAAHCGLKGFSSWRVGSDSLVTIPFENIGRWIGPDGSSIVAVVRPEKYSSTITSNLANGQFYNNRIINLHAISGLYLDYKYCGTGDKGGGPGNSTVNWLEQSVTTTGGLINVLSAGADQLYRDLTPAQVNQLPSHNSELLGTLGSGSYTSHPEMKRYNRLNEQRADAAERAAVIADWLQGGSTYPQQRLNQAWELFLWCQFHDVLPGTSIPAAYTFAWNDELLALSAFGAEETCGAAALSRALDTRAAGVPLMVYNPLSMPRQEIVEARVIFTNGAPAAVRVFDAAGTEVPAQMGEPSGDSVPVAFLATVPAVGAAVYDARPSDTPCALNTGLSATSSQLQNQRYTVQVNANGNVTSIRDRVANRELLIAPISWDFLLETNGSAWKVMNDTVTRAPYASLGAPATIRVLENGPARVSLEVSRNNRGSAFVERIRLAAGATGDRLEWDVSAKWGSTNTLLKVRFPLAVSNSRATFDLGLGTIERGNATTKIYEVPAQQWADLTDQNGAYGVTILNDAKIGWDKPDNNTLRLTLFHSPAQTTTYPYQYTNGFGSHRFSFAVEGHSGDWRKGASPWMAARLNQPLQAFQVLPHAGTLGGSFGFLSCNNSNVMVKALKRAEDSNEIVVRLQELAGQSQAAQISCAGAITAARQLNGAEEAIGALSPSGGVLNVWLGAYKPMTIALTVAPPGTLLPRTASTPVALPFNLDAISTDGNRSDGNFDFGCTYPAELMPASLTRDGVTFQLGPTNNGALNAVSCQGQTIALNSAGYTHLYLLAAAASTATTGSFTLNPGGATTSLTVPYFAGFYGQFCPPTLVSGEPAWICTHRHSPGKNNAYIYCYLYKFCLPVPPGTTSVVLPNAPSVRVFALTLTSNTAPETVAAGGPLGRTPPPWAEAGPDRAVNACATNAAALAALDGSASAAPGGSIVSYAWYQAGSLLATGICPVVSLPLGTNAIALRVTDNQGQTAMDSATITVLPPLSVSVTASPTNSSSPPLTVQFSSQAAAGSGYWWEFGDGASLAGQNVQHTYTNAGNYLARVSVTNGAYSGTNTVLITIAAPLVGTVGATPSLGTAPLTVQFSAQAFGGNAARSPYNTLADGYGAITAQGDHPPNETMDKAFDGTVTTKWLDFAGAHPESRSSWIQYQYPGGARYVVSQYAVSSANDAITYSNRNPMTWRLLGANDLGGPWTTLDIRNNQVFTTNYQTRAFSAANWNACNIYRLQIDNVADPTTANSVQLSELQFIGLPAYSYSWSFGDGTTSTARNPQHTYTGNGTYTVTLVVSDGTARATYNLGIEARPLTLGIEQPAPGQLRLNWPAWAANCSLCSATNLSPPVVWSPVTNTISLENGTNFVTVSIGGDPAERFFQLRGS